MQKTKESAPWTKNLIEGLVCLFATGFLFWYLRDLEINHKTESINWVIALLYNIGGKWLVCAVTLAVSIAEFRAAYLKKREGFVAPVSSTQSS